MCVICVKPSGYDLPSDEYIHNMWVNNDDGAGYMYSDGRKVFIDKGYMTEKSFTDALNKLKKNINVKDVTLVMHFRIGTSGGNTPQNTHPFPMSKNVDKLKALHTTTGLGVAHNGIINIKTSRPDISDTMEYIMSILSPAYNKKDTFYKSDKVMKQIEGQINGSRMVFLLPSGRYYKIGNWVREGGLFYSNSSYKEEKKYSFIIPYSYDYDDYDEYYRNYTDANYDIYSPDVERKLLMPLPEGSYIVSFTNGNYIEVDDDFMIDSKGDVYSYYGKTAFHKNGLAMKYSSSYCVFSSSNLEVKFDVSKAVMIDVYNYRSNY